MDYQFQYKFVKSAPRKVRLVADFVRNMKPEEAIIRLKFLQKDAAKPVQELIKSGLSALSQKNIDPEKITIKSIQVNGGPMLKRRRFRSRGRADTIQKKTSHIFLILNDEEKSKTRNPKSETNSKSKLIKSKTRNKV